MCEKMTIRLTFLLRYDDIYHLSRLSPTIFHQSFSFCRKDSGLIIQHFLHTFPHILPVFFNNIKFSMCTSEVGSPLISSANR